MKQRWFNYRPICLVFAFLLLGSVFAFYISRAIAITIISSVAVASLLLFIAIWKKNARYIFVPMIAFVLGVGLFYFAIFNFNKTVDSTPINVQARVCNISNETDGMIIVELDDCAFDGKKVNVNVMLFIYDTTSLFENIEIGSIIEFEPYKFYKTDIFYYETPNASLYAKDLKYTASVYINNVTYLKTDKTFAETIKEKVKDNLYLGLTNENAEIAYSALFGDKAYLSDKEYTVYKLSGTAHLLAVSGLHVGIIVAFLNKILRRIKINRWIKFSIIAIFLAFYTYICGFTISIVRASIMALILLLSKNLGRPYDSLNSISVAGIVIFLFNPLCMFDVGFLLSFSCVLGITLLSDSVFEALKRTKMNEKFARSLSISIATTVTIMMCMAYFFRTLNIISILANIILIPIFTLAFTAVFAVSILSLIIPPLSYLIYPLNYIFDFINITATILGNLPISNFVTIRFRFVAIIVYFVLLLFLSRFNTAKFKDKAISALPILAILLCCLL